MDFETLFAMILLACPVLLIFILIRIIFGKKQKCPFCAEKIKKGATICRHCGKEIPVLEKKENTLVSGIKSGQKALSTEIKSSRESLYLFLSCVFMFIPVFISLGSYERAAWWGFATEILDIRPGLITTMVAVFMYSSLIVRGVIAINLKTEKTTVLIMEIVLLSFNILFIASFLSIFASEKTFFGISPQAIFVFGIALSWLGVKSIAGYVWVILFLLSLGNVSKINEAMGFLGAIYVISAFVSIAFQFIPNNKFSDLAQAFKSDFKVAKTEIQEDLHEAKATTEKIVKATIGKTSSVDVVETEISTPVLTDGEI